MRLTYREVVRNALHQLCRKIQEYKKSGWTDKNRPVQMAIARHDKILRRYPNAYVAGQ